VSAAAGLKVAIRVVLVTVLFTLLGFAVGGFLGVVSVIVMRAAHLPISVQGALWFGAIPGGVLGMIVGRVIISVSEKRARGV
jgi:pilus assembly protein TadC